MASLFQNILGGITVQQNGNTGARHKFDKKQYEILLRCSESDDLSEWKNWRETNPEKPILLEGANLEDIELWNVDLQDAELCDAVLRGAKLRNSNLRGAKLALADLRKAVLTGANIQGAIFETARLEKAKFDFAIVDGKTLIKDCKFDEDTDFTGVGLDSARVAPRLKESLKNNIRRKQWQKWYDEANCWQKKILNYVVKLFWWISDYGSSTKRIIWCFFGLAFIFAIIYWILGIAGYFLCHYNLCYIDDFIFCSVGPIEYKDGHIINPGVIDKLFGDMVNDSYVSYDPWIIPLRAIYFSVVTMTTLGFGDMYANPGSWFGHILLMLQVLLGYIMLGALVTRFAILFSGGGPAKESEKDPISDKR